MDLIQKQIKGKELDFKIGQIPCPNLNCQHDIKIKLRGELTAFIQTCPICMVQFSVWTVDPNSSKCIINVLSEETLQQRRVVSGNVNLREQAGIETQTTILEWLHDGAIITSNIANYFKKKGDSLSACNHYFQAASMYKGLGFLETSENKLKSLEKLLPDISMKDREKFSHDITRLRKQTSEGLRSRDFTYIFISCPNCGTEHQIRASATTVANELCSNCRSKFSVFYHEETQEFYTNILEKSKTKGFSLPERFKRSEVKFCARCGLKVGIISRFVRDMG